MGTQATENTEIENETLWNGVSVNKIPYRIVYSFPGETSKLFVPLRVFNLFYMANV